MDKTIWRCDVPSRSTRCGEPSLERLARVGSGWAMKGKQKGRSDATPEVSGESRPAQRAQPTAAHVFDSVTALRAARRVPAAPAGLSGGLPARPGGLPGLPPRGLAGGLPPRQQPSPASSAPAAPPASAAASSSGTSTSGPAPSSTPAASAMPKLPPKPIGLPGLPPRAGLGPSPAATSAAAPAQQPAAPATAAAPGASSGVPAAPPTTRPNLPARPAGLGGASLPPGPAATAPTTTPTVTTTAATTRAATSTPAAGPSLPPRPAGMGLGLGPARGLGPRPTASSTTSTASTSTPPAATTPGPARPPMPAAPAAAPPPASGAGAVPPAATSAGRTPATRPAAPPPAAAAAATPPAAPAPAAAAQAPAPAADTAVDPSEDPKGRKAQAFCQNARVTLIRAAGRLGLRYDSEAVQQFMTVIGRLETLNGAQLYRNYGRRVDLPGLAQREARELDSRQAGGRLDLKIKVLLLGISGMGKSELINALLERPAARTSAFQAATRGIRVARGEVAGIKLELIDTPGLHPSSSASGHNRAVLKAVKAAYRWHKPNYVFWVDRLDSSRTPMADLALLQQLNAALGTKVWRETMIVLTHAHACRTAMGNAAYDTFTKQRRNIMAQVVRQAAGDAQASGGQPPCHPSCPTNSFGQPVIMEGAQALPWKQVLMMQLVGYRLYESVVAHFKAPACCCCCLAPAVPEADVQLMPTLDYYGFEHEDAINGIVAEYDGQVFTRHGWGGVPLNVHLALEKDKTNLCVQGEVHCSLVHSVPPFGPRHITQVNVAAEMLRPNIKDVLYQLDVNTFRDGLISKGDHAGVGFIAARLGEGGRLTRGPRGLGLRIQDNIQLGPFKVEACAAKMTSDAAQGGRDEAWGGRAFVQCAWCPELGMVYDFYQQRTKESDGFSIGGWASSMSYDFGFLGAACGVEADYVPGQQSLHIDMKLYHSNSYRLAWFLLLPAWNLARGWWQQLKAWREGDAEEAGEEEGDEGDEGDGMTPEQKQQLQMQQLMQLMAAQGAGRA
ncbi:hypothetical protein QJQ45_015102 [Haematococcus lacustris]|nr:hypothetical protein QJQ45_015102 [Haematococcus lacustris]